MTYIVVAFQKASVPILMNAIPILLTEDLTKAVRTARTAEDLGYVLTEGEGINEIGVWLLKPEQVFSFAEFKYSGAPPKDFPNIMVITKSQGKVWEAWGIKRKLEAKFATCGCEGSCPVCVAGEVEYHHCNRCGVDFCPTCHGITSGHQSNSVLPCNCHEMN